MDAVTREMLRKLLEVAEWMKSQSGPTETTEDIRNEIDWIGAQSKLMDAADAIRARKTVS